MANYYASPTGTGIGTIGDPFDLQTALENVSQTSGDTLYLRGGTYNGKFRSSLAGGTVRSYPGEWAVLDGYVATTLVGAIDNSQTAFVLANGTGFFDFGDEEVGIDGEIIKLFGLSGNNVTNSLRGASDSNAGAEAHSNGAVVVLGGDHLRITGSNTVYRDFEVTNSRPTRNGNTSNQGISRGDGVRILSANNKLINLVIHETLDGIFTSNTSSNTELYGCVIYNNGMHRQVSGTEEGFGHGMYLENGSGFIKIHDCISVNNFNFGAQFYGVTASFVNGDCNGTIFANNGSPLRTFDANKANFNLIYGTASVISDDGSVTNSHFFHKHNLSGSDVNFGYGAGVTDGIFTGNYMIGGGNLLEATNTLVNLTCTGNTLYSRNGSAQYTIIPNSGTSGWTWNNNTYHDSGGRTPFGINGVGLFSFANWKTNTGFDASSTETSVDIPDTVVIRPNTYETGRANVIIYAPSNPSSININLSTTGLTNGQSYIIKNAFDYNGGNVTSGTYNSASPTISMSLTGNALNVATPIGFAYTPTTTVTDFGVFVVIPTSAVVTTVNYYGSTPSDVG